MQSASTGARREKKSSLERHARYIDRHLDRAVTLAMTTKCSLGDVKDIAKGFASRAIPSIAAKSNGLSRSMNWGGFTSPVIFPDGLRRHGRLVKNKKPRRRPLIRTRTMAMKDAVALLDALHAIDPDICPLRPRAASTR